MSSEEIYNAITSPVKQKKFAVLIDPDEPSDEEIIRIITLSVEAHVDFFFIGGSLLVKDNLDHCIQLIKAHCKIPVVLFPGSNQQISSHADALLLLSLISGRNAELLIGQHVTSAPFLKRSPLEILSTGYMLIDSGQPTTVSYISNTQPIPRNKKAIAACTAMAGELLGMKLIFMDAGSGAQHPIPADMIRCVSQSIDIPLIIGGGINTVEKAVSAVEAGADIIVVGNAIEKDASLIRSIGNALADYKQHSIKQ